MCFYVARSFFPRPAGGWIGTTVISACYLQCSFVHPIERYVSIRAHTLLRSIHLGLIVGDARPSTEAAGIIVAFSSPGSSPSASEKSMWFAAEKLGGSIS